MLERLLTGKCEGCKKRQEWLKQQMEMLRERAKHPFSNRVQIPTPQVQHRRSPNISKMEKSS